MNHRSPSAAIPSRRSLQSPPDSWNPELAADPCAAEFHGAHSQDCRFAVLYFLRPSAFQPFRLRQFRLPLIERPEAFRFQLQRTRHVQTVEGSHCQPGTVPARELSANFKGPLRQRSVFKHPCLLVRNKLAVNLSGYLGGHMAAKLVLRQSVGPLCPVKGSKNDRGAFFHAAPSLDGMDVS